MTISDILANVVIDKHSDCWRWVGLRDRDRYGRIVVRGKRGYTRKYPAHRFVYENLVGPITSKYQIHHTCRVPCCVNPDHLQALTAKEHAAIHPMQAHLLLNKHPRYCYRGHEFTNENTHHTKRGRICKKCASIKTGEQRRKRIEAGLPRFNRDTSVTHCKHGHEYNEENTKYSRFSIYCATCAKERANARYRKSREGKPTRAEAKKSIRVYRERVLRRTNLPSAHKTHCVHGHEYTHENTYIRVRGSRMCRECMRLSNQRRSERNRDNLCHS